MTGKRLAGLLTGVGLWAAQGFAPGSVSTLDVVEGRVVRGDRPAAGAVVYLMHEPVGDRENGRAPPAVADTVVLDQRALTFLPRVVAVRPGTTVAFLNNDLIQHNVFGPGRPVGVGVPFDLGTYSQGEVRYHTFVELGAHTILCNVHPEMVAYVFSAATDHRAVTDSDGRFSLGDVPSGAYRLHVWHPLSQEFEVAIRVQPDMRPLAISLDPEG